MANSWGGGSAAYDLNGNGSVLDDPRELYTYDEQWRVVAIHRQGPANQLEVNAPTPQRPPAQLYQRFVYHQDGLPAQGVSAGVIDRVVLRQRDADDNPDTGPDGLEETLYYIQNSRGDVMQVIRPIAGPSDEWWNDDRGGYAVESVRYSLYGVPTAIASADINRDGVVDERDVSLFVNGWVQGEIDRRLDVNNNGRLETGPPIDPANGLPISNWDDDDLSLFTKEFVGLYQWRLANDPTTPDPTTALFDGTGTDADGIARGKLSREDIDNRIGAAGMWWDPHLGIYHVRHRAYDPRLGRFLQPDPIGVAGGWNVFEYVGGDPANYVDPMGLQRVPPGWPADPNGALFGIERGFRQEREAAFAWGRDLAGHVKIATETGVTVAAVGAIVILPGPEDVVLAAAMSRHGIAALKIVGDKLIGIMKGGDEIELVGKTADEVGDAVRKDGAVGHPARADAKSADEAAACKGPPDRAVDAASIKKKSPHELGNEGEHAVAQILGLPKNTKRIDSLSGTANYRIPDFLDEKNLRIIADSKNVKKLEPSDQLLDFALYAQKHGLAYRIYVRENTVISPAMREFATNNGIRVFRSLPPG